MDSLVALSNDGLDTLEVRSLGSPISGGSRTVFLTSKNDELMSFRLILSGSIEDSEFLSRGNVDSLRSDLVDHLVDESGVGESTTGHDFIVTSSSTVGVEVLSLDVTFVQVSGGGGVLSNGTSRRDVIGGDGVTKVQEAVSILDVLDGLGDKFGALEEGRVVNVS